MSMLRSADMLFVRLIIGADSLIATFDELGRFGKLHLENVRDRVVDFLISPVVCLF